MKSPKTVEQQIQLLSDRGMQFRDLSEAHHYFKNISYYRLKGYWWDLQLDKQKHLFKPNVYFEDALATYTFDRQLKLILFDAIERIEIALRTKMIYHLSLSYSPLWYLDKSIFNNADKHQSNLDKLKKEFGYSQEAFIKDHKRRHPSVEPESWKIMEVASMGILSKYYKTLNHQLPEKAKIANEMGLNLHSELSSWLESIVYVRNIIAHHSRLWSRNMVKMPIERINNPSKWFLAPLAKAQTKKAFLIISAMIYLCDHVTPNHQIKFKIKALIANNPNIPIYKIGFFNDWDKQPVWS